MAGLFKAPSRFAPHVNLPASRARTNDVLTNLVEAGYMSAGQVHAARLNPAKYHRYAAAPTAPTGSSTGPSRRRSAWARAAATTC